LAFQVIASVAPEDMREQMYERFYKNHLAFLAMHPVANFVVQAVLATINKSPQVTHLSCRYLRGRGGGYKKGRVSVSLAEDQWL